MGSSEINDTEVLAFGLLADVNQIECLPLAELAMIEAQLLEARDRIMRACAAIESIKPVIAMAAQQNKAALHSTLGSKIA